MEDSEKGAKGARPISPNKQRQRKKTEVCNEVLKRLQESGHEAVDSPGFAEGIHAHFQRLPARYVSTKCVIEHELPYIIVFRRCSWNLQSLVQFGM